MRKTWFMYVCLHSLEMSKFCWHNTLSLRYYQLQDQKFKSNTLFKGINVKLIHKSTKFYWKIKLWLHKRRKLCWFMFVYQIDSSYLCSCLVRPSCFRMYYTEYFMGSSTFVPIYFRRDATFVDFFQLPWIRIPFQMGSVPKGMNLLLEG